MEDVLELKSGTELVIAEERELVPATQEVQSGVREQAEVLKPW
jgi:hypothetical protein